MSYEIQKEIEIFFEYLNVEKPTIVFEYDPEVEQDLVSIKSTETELFLNNNKELLFAFNSILKKSLEGKYSSIKPFVLDFNGEQKKFINQAKQKAEIAYRRVLQFGKPYEFGYLNGFERMIVHSYLKQKKEINTISHGERKDRRLVVSSIDN